MKELELEMYPEKIRAVLLNAAIFVEKHMPFYRRCLKDPEMIASHHEFMVFFDAVNKWLNE